MSTPIAHKAPTTASNGLATLLAWARRQPRRNLLLVALLPFLVVAWLPLLRGKQPGASRSPTDPVASEAPPAAPLGEFASASTAARVPAEANVPAFATRLETLVAPYTMRWSPTGDPRPFGRTAPVGDAPTTGPEITYQPSAIVISRGAPPIAIVQGQLRRVGDRIGGRTLVTIDEDRIVYREGDVVIPIALPQPRLGGSR